MVIGQRPLGRSGQCISAVGFVRGNQAGLLVRGDSDEQVRVIARAVELGISCFDSAAQYGNGQSERTLGRMTSGPAGERSLSIGDLLGPVLDVFRTFRAEARVRFHSQEAT